MKYYKFSQEFAPGTEKLKNRKRVGFAFHRNACGVKERIAIRRLSGRIYFVFRLLQPAHVVYAQAACLCKRIPSVTHPMLLREIKLKKYMRFLLQGSAVIL